MNDLEQHAAMEQQARVTEQEAGEHLRDLARQLQSVQVCVLTWV